MAEAIRGTLIDSLGRPVAGASVQINISGGGAASLYSDEALVNPLANPLTSESDGSYGPAYLANGRYNVIPSKTGYTFDASDLTDILIYDIDEDNSVTGGVPGKDLLVRANSNGLINASFGGGANTLATLNSSQKVVEAPADAQVAAASTKIPLQSGSRGLDPSWDNTPTVLAYHSTGASGLTAGATYKVGLDTTLFDTHGDFDTANSKFIPQTAGKYLIVATIAGTSTTSITQIVILIYKNGSSHRRIIFPGLTGSISIRQLSALVTANGSSDYFEMYVSLSGAGTLTVNPDPYGEGAGSGTSFAATRVGK